MKLFIIFIVTLNILHLNYATPILPGSSAGGAAMPWTQWMKMKGLPTEIVDSAIPTFPVTGDTMPDYSSIISAKIPKFPPAAAAANSAPDAASMDAMAPWTMWMKMKGLPASIIEASLTPPTPAPGPEAVGPDALRRSIIDGDLPKKTTKKKSTTGKKKPLAKKPLIKPTLKPKVYVDDPIDYTKLAKSLIADLE